jgi:purine-nucleoside phosphorylase
MITLKEKIAETTSFLRPHIKSAADVGIILGTGLGELSEKMEIEASVDYNQIPHFPISTVQSHHGRLLSGTLSGKAVVAMQGSLRGVYSSRGLFPCQGSCSLSEYKP